MTDRRTLLRQLPAIDRLLNAFPLRELAGKHPHAQLREAATAGGGGVAPSTADETAPLPDIGLAAAARLAAAHLQALERPSLRRVLNLTGTVLHTNFGRRPLGGDCPGSGRGGGPRLLDPGIRSGGRAARRTPRPRRGTALPPDGAEAALAVNNNAGAVLVALSALAGGHSALVSRGELIEIGGSFRIPEIMAAGGSN